MAPRRILLAVLAAGLALLVAPAVASAHHLDNNASTVDCELVNNVPTLTVSARFVAFEDFNKPVNYTVIDNDRTIDTNVFTWSGPDYTKNLSYVSTFGRHTVTFRAWWGNHDTGGSGSFTRTVVCPAAIPPPPPPPPAAAPPPPPPTTPVALPPHKTKAPCVPYPKSRFTLRDTPNMNGMAHGKVTWRVRGPHIKWVRFHVDHRYAITDRSRPFKVSMWLWRTDIWGPALWGEHTISATIRTKCGVVKLQDEEFNHDPPIR